MHSAFRIFHYSAVFDNVEYQWNINGSPCLIRRIISAQNKLSNRSVHTSTNNKIIMYGRSILAWNFVFKRHHHLSLCLSKPDAGYERSAQSQQRLIASTSTKLFTRGEYKQYKCQLDRKKKTKKKKNQKNKKPRNLFPKSSFSRISCQTSRRIRAVRPEVSWPPSFFWRRGWCVSAYRRCITLLI